MANMNTEQEEWTAGLLAFDFKPLHQKHRHNPPESIGDCFRTCIASLLGAHTPEDVPHFAEQTGLDVDNGGWEDRRLARHWLRSAFNIDLMTVKLDAAKGYGVPYLVSVQSKVGPWCHVVVGQGEEVIHDPAGNPAGYTLADVPDHVECADVLCEMYEPDPDEMVRIWEASR